MLSPRLYTPLQFQDCAIRIEVFYNVLPISGVKSTFSKNYKNGITFWLSFPATQTVAHTEPFRIFGGGHSAVGRECVSEYSFTMPNPTGFRSFLGGGGSVTVTKTAGL